MIGIHFQKTIPGWNTATAAFPANTLHKVVSDQFMCRDIARLGQRAIFRHPSQREQAPAATLEENKVKARQFFSEFIDGTFWEQELWRYMFGIEEWNEHIIAFPDRNEEARFLSWCDAVGAVWRDDYQQRYPTELGHIPLVFLNVPVGNDFRIEFARIVAKYNGIASYHGYTHVINGEIDSGDKEYHSGRWMTLDAQFAAQGIKLRWVSTEGGPYAGVYDGWRAPQVFNGNFDKYLDSLRYQLDYATAWNAQHGNRFLGWQLFTVGRTGRWDMYELDATHIQRIGELARNYTPPQPPPPPPPPTIVTQPRVPYRRKTYLVPQDATLDEWLAAARLAYATRSTLTGSADDAGYGAPGTSTQPTTVAPLVGTEVQLVGFAAADVPIYTSWYATHYPGTQLAFVLSPTYPHEIHDIVDTLPKHATLRYATRPLTGITTLTIHHTVSPPDRAVAQLAQYHVEHNGWPGIGYHFVIGADGTIWQTNHIETKSYHAGSAAAPGDENAISIGIALQGDFTSTPPPQAQLDATAWLVQYLRDNLPTVSTVIGHKEMPGASTACPGATWAQWRASIGAT